MEGTGLINVMDGGKPDEEILVLIEGKSQFSPVLGLLIAKTKSIVGAQFNYF